FEISGDAYGEVESELRNYLKGIYSDYFVTGKLFDQLFADAEKNKAIPPILLNMFKQNLPEQIKNLNIEAYIPSMAKRLAGELKKKEPKIKEVLKSELDNILIDRKDSTIVDNRLLLAQTYGFNTVTELEQQLTSSIQKDKNNFKESVISMTTLIALIMILSIVLYLITKNLSLLIGSLSLLSIILLICGI
ncbi:MAG TPA: hypothetical protein PKD85_19260, partial [Saprospiraceae bacterium]|nr:hypothetical protein [Saprospiraceae bacterium]